MSAASDSLISTALLGAGRMTALPPAPTAALEESWRGISTENPAAALLQALALTRAMKLAGVKTSEAPAEEEAAGDETSFLLSPAATAVLLRALKGDFPETLSECLRLATATQRIVPGRALPELLQAAAKQRDLRPAARLLWGQRGLWIARRHKDFAWLLEEAAVPESAWDDGQPVERLAWLRQTRREEADKAAVAIVAQWSGEDVPMREAIVKVIAENPRPCDEAWLEDLALKDRRAEVREQAIIALSALPGSGFRKRAAERLKACVTVKRKLLRRVIEAWPPAAFQPEWTRDGLKEKPPQGTGEKTWWLRQIVAAVPLGDWPQILEIKPDDLFSLTLDGDWREAVFTGWMDSARRKPALCLPRLFIPWLLRLEPWPASSGHAKGVLVAALLREIPVTERYEILEEISGDLALSSALELLAATSAAPPAGKGRKILAMLNRALDENAADFPRYLGRPLAMCIPAEQIQLTLERIAALPQLNAAIEDFATTLEFRRSLHLHFQTSAPA